MRIEYVDRVVEVGELSEAAVAAARQHGLVVTARAENLLYGAAGLDDTIERRW